MKKLSLLAIIILTKCSVFGQSSVSQELLDQTVLVELYNQPQGSGFIYNDSTHVYFVTARHVVLNEIKDHTGKVDYQFISQKGTIKFYARTPERSEPNTMSIDFHELYKAGLLKFGLKDDILVAKIGTIKYDGYSRIEYVPFVERSGAISRLNSMNWEMVGKFDSTIIGDDVLISGFPASLGLKQNPQYDFKRPILRKGTLAGRYVEQKTLIIDCPSFGGNSGGPVIEVGESLYDNRVRLIGIVTSFIPLVEEWKNERYGITNVEVINSGYTVVEPIDKILDLIKEIK